MDFNAITFEEDDNKPTRWSWTDPDGSVHEGTVTYGVLGAIPQADGDAFTRFRGLKQALTGKLRDRGLI
jgi:hypothetical protein